MNETPYLTVTALTSTANKAVIQDIILALHESTYRTMIPPRALSKRLQARGMFPGAHIVRGHDWRWGNQDGMYNLQSFQFYIR